LLVLTYKNTGCHRPEGCNC